MQFGLAQLANCKDPPTSASLAVVITDMEVYDSFSPLVVFNREVTPQLSINITNWKSTTNHCFHVPLSRSLHSQVS